LTFRRARRGQFPDAAENERRLEINEGLAQYTATVAVTNSQADAEQDAVYQLMNATLNATLVRTFPYSSGAAYGLLLDEYSPGWRGRIKVTDDLGSLVEAAAKIHATGDPGVIARSYGGTELRVFEERREAERKERVAEMQRRFVNGPVLVLPAATTASFSTNGMTPIPGVGTLYPTYRGSGEWGSVEAAAIVVSKGPPKLILAAPAAPTDGTAAGDGWKVTLAPGWSFTRGARPADYQVVPKPPGK
jgi:hypothetical protein